MRILMSIFAVMALVAAGPVPAWAGANSTGGVVSFSDVLDLASPNLDPIQPGSASLSRNSQGAELSVTASGLTPENVYTVWWVVFNHPNFCAGGIGGCGAADFPFNGGDPRVGVGIFWASGGVADEHGRATFHAHTLVGGGAKGVSLLGTELETTNAEIHFVIRCHNEVGANGSTLQEQMTTLDAGCIGPCPDVAAGVFPP